ncbi:translation initiation factor IF-2 [Enterobacteriaceae endosymbiont of Donacia simplex]|uniref:translation initiation factor IF-2 n=1 Tax=Enterobacteriaceae endosymbiont of Donacia simplex TaxID=2675784 RepID=UPI001449A527|nr:translation initiation factor IF-2 [Enterobacteriaceae endosymbiont of Donacia simplex]QJC36599.1 translation initiation factor IF-2 [Enterobacteriaceae endosymbiont of Donacia simplex]
MTDAVITIKLLASKIKISVKNIIKYFADIGISKLENDIVSKEENKKFLIYLKNKKIKNFKLLNINHKSNKLLDNEKIFLSKDKKNLLKQTSLKINNYPLSKKKKLKKFKQFIKNNDKKIYNTDYKKNLELNKKKINKNKKYYKKKINNKNLNNNIFNKKIYNKKKYKNNKENKKKIINNKYKKKFSKLYQNFNKPVKNINRNIIINDTISITELSNKMAVKSSKLIKIIINMGEKFTNINQLLNQETAQLIAEEMGHKVILRCENDIEKSLINNEDQINKISIIRPPIVTIMGHVDHGKTSLLDYIFSSNITSKESGGITQYINAYQIKFNNKKITFLDTPGHESFTSMRLRGVQVTDIIILVIAIDDGVMPQTIEAIKYAKKTKLPIIVVINKIDKKISNLEQIKNELSRYDIISEEWGGDNIFVKVSAKTGEGINNLLNTILLQAEILELKAINKGIAKGIVIESFLDKGKGPIASVLIKEGMLKKGNIVLCGYTYGKIKGLINYKGLNILQAGPSTPIKIIGLSEIPHAGDNLIVVNNEKQAKEIASYRKNKYREIQLSNKQKQFKKVFLDLNNKNIHEINILLKADVQGSLEAITTTLINLSNDKINIKIIYSGVGEITETDISMAMANLAKHVIIIGFNVKASKNVKNIMKIENIKIKFFIIIYDLINYMKKHIQKILVPEYKELTLGLADVRSIFTIPKIGVIAGCLVTYGIIKRNNLIKLFRNNKIFYKGVIDSLRRFKESVNEVRNGMECGISIKNFNDIHIGDKIEIFETNELIKK